MPSAIRPTTTQRVRRFLDEHGLAPAPWVRLDETHAALYRLMRARTDDDAFWKPLAGLLGDIVADAAEGTRRLPAKDAELLRSWDVDELVRDLRRALPSRWDGDTSARRYTSSLAAPALGGFLLLGLAAAGCDTAQDGGSTTWADGCSLDDGTGLYAAIDDNGTLTTDDKAALCGCMASMASAWQTNLSVIFEGGCDAETIATVLEDLVAQCDDGGGSLAADPSDDAAATCYGAPAYKGVSFPS